MNSSTPVVITEQFTFYKGYLKGYFDVEDSDQLAVCWKDKNQTYEDEETVRMQQGSLLMEVDLWKSVVLRIPTDQWDYPFRQNPLLKALPNKGWCSIDIELEKFLNLEKLRLQDNTVISDINLSKSTNLTKLDLKDNSVITDNSLSMLTNLTNLDLNFNSMITDKSICNAYKSEGIRYRV